MNTWPQSSPWPQARLLHGDDANASRNASVGTTPQMNISTLMVKEACTCPRRPRTSTLWMPAPAVDNTSNVCSQMSVSRRASAPDRYIDTYVRTYRGWCAYVRGSTKTNQGSALEKLYSSPNNRHDQKEQAKLDAQSIPWARGFLTNK